MRWLAILLATLLYTSTVKSSLPFFGPGGLEYEVKSQVLPQIQVEEKDVGELEHTDRTLTEIDEEEAGEENIESEEETQTETEEKEEERKKIGSKELIEQKDETQKEMEEEDEYEYEEEDEEREEGDIEDEEEVDMVEGEGDGKESHQDWKEMGNKDMDAEESEESRRLELTPGSPRAKFRRGGDRRHGNRGRGQPGQFPYVAYVELIQCKCTGFLLTDSWILTSSHCFLVDPLFRNLQAGRVYMGTASVPVSEASLPHVQLRIIGEVKVVPAGGEEPRGRAGEDEMPCKLTNRTQGAMQESRRCAEVKRSGNGPAAKSLAGPANEDGDETEDDEGGDDADEEDEALGRQERPAGSGELALVKVDDKFEMNNYVGFIRLMKLPFPGSLACRAVGFVGNRATGERKRLRWRKLEVWNGTKCNFMHSLALDKDSLCSKGPKGRPGCSEDIGGPVVCGGGAAAALVAHSLSERGVTAVYDCQKRVTNVFVMGGAHLPWIRSIVRDLPLPVKPPENKPAPLPPHQARSFTRPDQHEGRSGGVTTTVFSLTSGSSGLSGMLAGCGFLLHKHM